MLPTYKNAQPTHNSSDTYQAWERALPTRGRADQTEPEKPIAGAVVSA